MRDDYSDTDGIRRIEEILKLMRETNRKTDLIEKRSLTFDLENDKRKIWFSPLDFYFSELYPYSRTNNIDVDQLFIMLRDMQNNLYNINETFRKLICLLEEISSRQNRDKN